MASDFEIQADDAALKAALKDLSSRLDDMKPAFQVIGEIIRTSVVRNFEVGGRYSAPGSWRGGPKSWQPLSIAALFAGKKSKFAAKSGKFKKGVEEKFKNRAILVKQGHLMKRGQVST